MSGTPPHSPVRSSKPCARRSQPTSKLQTRARQGRNATSRPWLRSITAQVLGKSASRASLSSMFEMSYAGEDHRETVLVGGSDNFFVAHGTTRLDHSRDSMLRGFVNAVAKREKGI